MKEAMEICEGVKGLVAWLNHNGFKTTDSGDGPHYADGMDGAIPCPMVAMTVPPEDIRSEADRLYDLLVAKGVAFDVPPLAAKPQIQASYDPEDRSAVILLTNVVDALVGMEQMTPYRIKDRLKVVT